LLVLGVFAGIGWVGYQLADVTECSGPRSDAWAEATLDRLDDAAADYDAWDSGTTRAQFGALADRAEARYQAQAAQATISCLETLQGHTEEFFYYEWQMYVYASQGNYDQADAYDWASIEANEAMMAELEAMAVEYGWDL
jgi:hypothetical protein